MDEAQGFREFAFGGTRYPVSKSLISLIPRTLAKGNARPDLVGTAYISGPRRWTWPSFIAINGTEYTDGGLGNLIYKNATGETLDLTHLIP